jgi:hypothetical protein
VPAITSVTDVRIEYHLLRIVGTKQCSGLTRDLDIRQWLDGLIHGWRHALDAGVRTLSRCMAAAPKDSGVVLFAVGKSTVLP